MALEGSKVASKGRTRENNLNTFPTRGLQIQVHLDEASRESKSSEWLTKGLSKPDLITGFARFRGMRVWRILCSDLVEYRTEASGTVQDPNNAFVKSF